MKTYQVYVLWSICSQKFYTGLSEDPKTRLIQHNTGVSKWTKRYAGSWELVWESDPMSLSEARKFENLLKRQKGGQGFFRLTGLDPAVFKSGS